ncbi:MAG: hypothetical protein K2P61_09375 [Burkholderiaceae bacterium]|nr:hypothetical protein [Burkholderiaceae bacterium]
MEKMVKISTDYLRAKGASVANEEFRSQINEFLEKTSADDELTYAIKKDLSKRIDHPFYKIPKTKLKIVKTHKVLVQEYCRLLILYNDQHFSKKLLKVLSSQQEQSLRKIPPRSQAQKARKKRVGKGVWEHPIPVKYIVENLLHGICTRDRLYIERVLSIYEQAGSFFLTDEENSLIDPKYKQTMPENWSFNAENIDLFIRYRIANIDFEN